MGNIPPPLVQSGLETLKQVTHTFNGTADEYKKKVEATTQVETPEPPAAPLGMQPKWAQPTRVHSISPRMPPEDKDTMPNLVHQSDTDSESGDEQEQ